MPGKGSFKRCVSKVSRKGGALDPRAVCAAAKRKSGEKLNIGGASMLAAEGIKQVDKWRRKMAKSSGKRTRKNGRLSRRNSIEAAESRYEAFHGRPSEERIHLKIPMHTHSVLSGLGELVRLVIIRADGRKVKVSGFGGSILCQNEEATQLFIEGGDQSVDLEQFGLYGPYHETEVLGVCQRVIYYTTKDHLRPEDGGTANYNHKFGGMKTVTVRGKRRRVRSEYPTVVYDVRNKLLSFAGGGYTIPDEGIAN